MQNDFPITPWPGSVYHNFGGPAPPIPIMGGPAPPMPIMGGPAPPMSFMGGCE